MIREKFKRLAKQAGWKSITDFATKTGRCPLTVFNHLNNKVYDIRLLRAYAADLNITFFEALELFEIQAESNCVNVAKDLGFTGKNDSVLSKGNVLLTAYSEDEFNVIKIDPKELNSEDVVKLKTPVKHKEIQEYLISQSCRT